MAELPIYLQEQTFEAILQRLLSRVPPEYDTSEGSPLYDVFAAVAMEFAEAAAWAQDSWRRSTPSTAYGQWLDLKAQEFGLTRRPAVRATGTVTFTGQPGTVIPAGMQVSTASTDATPAVVFRTTQEATIGADGKVDVPIEAVEAGSSGNVGAGAIQFLAAPIPGVTGVTNAQPTSGGLDEEDDESLRQRILETASRDEGDGTVSDYLRWAKEVPGVGQVYVEPLWQGPGTVRVVILDANGDIPTPELVAAVQEHLDPGGQGLGLGRAPIGAKVTVQAPVEVAITVTVPGLQVEPGYDVAAVKDAIEAAVRAYIVSVSPGLTVRLKDVEAAIAGVPGVQDFGDVLLNGARSNIELDVAEKGTLAAVVYA